MSAARKYEHEETESASPQKRGLDEGTLAVVMQAHRREGYDSGYRRALVDVLAASVFVAEKVLLNSEPGEDARKVLYRFVELLESETLRFKRDESYIEGAGI